MSRPGRAADTSGKSYLRPFDLEFDGVKVLCDRFGACWSKRDAPARCRTPIPNCDLGNRPRARFVRRRARRRRASGRPQADIRETAMGQYTLRSIQLRDFARHEMLIIMAGFVDGAQAPARQRAIDGLVKLHGIDLKTTNSLQYDPTLTTRD